DAVEGAPAVLVHVQIVVDHGAEEASRLRATVGIGVAEGARRGIPLGLAAMLEPGDAVAERGHAEAEHARPPAGVGELIEPSLLEAALHVDMAGIGDYAPGLHAREAPAVTANHLHRTIQEG